MNRNAFHSDLRRRRVLLSVLTTLLAALAVLGPVTQPRALANTTPTSPTNYAGHLVRIVDEKGRCLSARYDYTSTPGQYGGTYTNPSPGWPRFVASCTDLTSQWLVVDSRGGVGSYISGYSFPTKTWFYLTWKTDGGLQLLFNPPNGTNTSYEWHVRNVGAAIPANHGYLRAGPATWVSEVAQVRRSRHHVVCWRFAFLLDNAVGERQAFVYKVYGPKVTYQRGFSAQHTCPHFDPPGPTGPANNNQFMSFADAPTSFYAGFGLTPPG